MTEHLQNTDRVWTLLEKTAVNSRNWEMPDFAGLEKPFTLSFLNAHGVNTALRNLEFYRFLMESDALLRDGIGVKIALEFFGLGTTENLNGTDLISKLIPHFRDRKLAIFGASDEALSACRRRLETEGISNIISMEHGFHCNDFYLRICNELKPDIVVLCMGMPRQELLAAELKKHRSTGLIVCGGGWVDFYSGVKIRAPDWMQKLSLEWLHRLYKEPKRLGKRYTVDILYYFYAIFWARIRKTV